MGFCQVCFVLHMDPKMDGLWWENPIKMDDLGYHYFRKHPYGGCVSVSQRRPVIHKPQKIQMTLAVYKKLNYEGWLSFYQFVAPFAAYHFYHRLPSVSMKHSRSWVDNVSSP